jgi:hypothetical protein
LILVISDSQKMDKELNDVITAEYNILDWHGAPVEYRPAPLVALQFHEVRLNLPMPPDPTQEKIKLDKQKKEQRKNNDAVLRAQRRRR